MKVSTTELRRNLKDILDHVAETGERVIVLRRGKVEGALISVEELGQLEGLDEVVARWEAEEEGHGTIDLEALDAELGLTREDILPAPQNQETKQ
jgi:prevent-host-death family protein